MEIRLYFNNASMHTNNAVTFGFDATPHAASLDGKNKHDIILKLANSTAASYENNVERNK